MSPDKRLTQYVHSAWTDADGLPSVSITSLLQTDAGYLWVGTNNGLARFDGLAFTVFDLRSSPPLTSGSIAALVQDDRGVLWVGTLGGGLLRQRSDRFEPVGPPDARIITLVTGSDGTLWVGGYGGLTLYRHGKWERHFGPAEGLVGDPVVSIHTELDGAAWVVTPTHLHRVSGAGVEVVPTTSLPANAALRDIFRLRDGTLVLRSLEGALYRRGDAQFERWIPSGTPDSLAVRWLIEDRDSNLWLGTEHHGLIRVNARGTTQYSEQDGFPGGRVRTMLEDSAGNLWLGTFDKGLHRFRDGAFATWGKPEGFASDTVYSVVDDRRGNTWVATGDGLMQIAPRGVRRFAGAHGLASASIHALHLMPDEDALWVGSMAGLDRFAHGRATPVLTKAQGLPVNRVTAVLQDRQGALWIGTFGGGVARYAQRGVEVYDHANGLADDYVYALQEATDGTLWIGTAHGVSLVRDGQLIVRPELVSLTGPTTTFHEDERGVMWIGTEAHGLYRHTPGMLVSLADVQGIPDDTVYCILADDQQRFWFSSYRGVFRIARSELDAAANGQPRVDAVSYGLADGVRSREGNGGQQPSGWRGRDGRLWFATLKGAAVVDPSRIVSAEPPPPVRIESMLAEDQLIDVRGDVRLPAGTRRLEVRYAAPDLSAPERSRFRLRLEGFDSDWQDVGSRRVAHFTNLPSGPYRLRVAARTGGGPWNSQEAVLSFAIAPYFYQEWWFRVLVVAVALVVLAFAYWFRLAWLEAQNAVLRERQRIAGEIHDNLAQSFSGVIHQAEAAMCRFSSDPAAAAMHMETVCELASHGAEAARRSMWELGARREGTDSLKQAITSAAHRMTQGRGVTVRHLDSELTWPLPRQVEHHLLCIAQAAIANAVEHSACTQIQVGLEYTPRALTLTVEDNGRGFDPSRVSASRGRGFGLENQRQRAREVGGRLRIESSAETGTRLQVAVPRRQWTYYLKRALRTAFGRQERRENAPKDPDLPA